MKLLSGRTSNANGDVFLFDLGEFGSVSLRLDRDAELEPEQEVVIGFRPEDIVVLPESAGGTAIAGIARTVLPAGSETLVEVQVRDAVLTVRLDRKTKVDAQSRVRIDLSRTEAHVFERSTGRCLGRSAL